MNRLGLALESTVRLADMHLENDDLPFELRCYWLGRKETAEQMMAVA